MIEGIIYKAVSKTTGKVYIGQTTQGLQRRISQHIRAAKNNRKGHFMNALRLYGKEDFEWSIICSIYDSTKELISDRLNVLERYFVSEYDSFNNGYNATIGGDGTTGHSLTPENKAKLLAANLGKKLSEEHKRKIGDSVRGKAKPDHMKTKLSETRKGSKKVVREDGSWYWQFKSS